MLPKRSIAAIGASIALAVGGVFTVGASSASAAASAPNCTEWHDYNTYGISCSGYSGGVQVRSTAECAVGTDKGPWKSAVTGGMSYVYCADQGGLWDWDHEFRRV